MVVQEIHFLRYKAMKGVFIVLEDKSNEEDEIVSYSEDDESSFV